MQNLRWIGELVGETGCSAETLLESFRRCAVSVQLAPVAGVGFVAPHVDAGAFERWKKLAVSRRVSKRLVIAVPLSLPTP